MTLPPDSPSDPPADPGEVTRLLHLARDGNIHLAYTWKRERIRHHVFNSAWLEP